MSSGDRARPCRRFSSATLIRFQQMPSEEALAHLAVTLKKDSTYLARKTRASRRWHVYTIRGDFEILTTGTKWYDTRAQRGGGGAIDLAMHIEGLSFVGAVKRLMQLFPRG